MNETINARIKTVRKMFCGGSNVEFARRLAKATNTTSNWVRNGYNVGKGVAGEISAEFSVSKGWLLTGDGEMLSPSQPRESVTASGAQSIAAGGSIGNVSSHNVNIVLPEKGFQKIIQSDGTQTTVEVAGSSDGGDPGVLADENRALQEELGLLRVENGRLKDKIIELQGRLLDVK